VTTAVGFGLRTPHLAEVERDRPPAGVLEIHAENYLLPSPSLSAVERLRADYRFSIHAVGLSLGSVDGLDAAHLARVAALVKKLDPELVSEHLAWSMHEGRYFNDLLPLPYTEEALDVVVRNVGRLQETLGRQVAVENLACYLDFVHSTLSEAEFLSELVRRSGCALLLDANNLHVTAHNLGREAADWLDVLPVGAVAEYHLAGHAVNKVGETTVLIDDHGSQVADPVWRLFERCVARFGTRPTVIEWDTDLPALSVLLDEARRASVILSAAQVRDARAA
jgi:uncharacterized protein (UPF0276 family)